MRDMNVGVLMVLSSDPGSTPGISTKKPGINRAFFYISLSSFVLQNRFWRSFIYGSFVLFLSVSNKILLDY